MDALRNWIRAAESIRSTCRNLPAFEALIRHQKGRLAGLMPEDIKSVIRSNIGSLFDAAELLASKGYYGPAVHLMMAAREEGVKWILVFCWSHLDQDTRAKIFSHDFKHKTAGIFYFLSGQLDAIDFAIGSLELLKEEEQPHVREAVDRLIELLPEAIKDDGESLAKTIISSLHHSGVPNEAPDITEKRKKALAKLVADAEQMRQNSIYVDFDQALQIGNRPQNFKKDDYDKVKRDVVLATYHIDKLSGLNPSRDVLHSLFPEWKDELEKSLRDAATRIKAAKQDK
jgi:AbiV family abortive infection protein